MRKSALWAAFMTIPIVAHADFVLRATPSSGPVSAQIPVYAHPQALPVARPPKPKPIAEGFGKDVPLESALRDILPVGMKSQLTAAVDPNSRVTWHGGRPWDVVLKDAVAPLGVSVRLAADGVVLSR